MPAPAPPAVRVLVVALYAANVTGREICKAIGCGESTPAYWARLQGIPAKRSGACVRDPVAIQEALDAYHRATGLTIEGIDPGFVAAAESPVLESVCSPKPAAPRGYTCPPDCHCLLCQLAEPTGDRRTMGAFCPRPELG